MKSLRLTTPAFATAFVFVAIALVFGQQYLPGEPQHKAGASITAAFEGWFTNKDGSYSLLIGYMNRNQTQALDIPIGPSNKFEPGAIDRGQPTHFLPGRQWGMFVITLPKNYPPTQQISWTIAANGQATTVPFYLHRDYEVSPFLGILENTPPVLRFAENGPAAQGPVAMTVERFTEANTPLSLSVWVSDDGKLTSAQVRTPPRNRDPVSLVWSKYRGPGMVTFEKDHPKVERTSADGEPGISGKATTTVTFSEAGDYMLHLTVNDYSGVGGGGFQCCWTTGLVNVKVK